MDNFFSISQEDILQQVKLSLQWPIIIETIVGHKLSLQKARDLSLEIETEELQKATDNYRIKNHLSSAKETMLWMQKNGLSIDDLEALIYQEVLCRKVTKLLFENKVESYFTENQLNYTKVAFYECILDSSELALELFYALQEKETTFFEVAYHYHLDPDMRKKIGYRGLVRRTELQPELSAAIFASQPPQLLKPIAVGKKIYLIWITEIINPILDETLRQEILIEMYLQWIRKQVSHLDLTQLLRL